MSASPETAPETPEAPETLETPEAPEALEALEAPETREAMEARHRKEKRDLVNRVTALKKTVSKGDKRKKKDVADEIAGLEAELAGRQAAELRLLAERAGPAAVEEQRAEGDSDDEGDGDGDGDGDDLPAAAPIGGVYGSLGQAGRPGGKKSKAKLRQQRKAEERRRQQEEAEREAEGMADPAAAESEAIERLVVAQGLSIREVRPDGHCLYSAVADQLAARHGQQLSHLQVRQRAAEYMRAHRDDFVPFMAHEDGAMFDEADFAKYCDDVERTAAWGGQQELTALSHSLELPIHVYQAAAPVLRVGEDAYGARAPLSLSYHRHAYGLGEHYNSLRQADGS
ncbi:OTU protein [Coemansia javaensis]|uniref:OTU protein n=1 Tax=Coemansia javaensis TaxID=2761396 RepID=A0A9W8LEF0_9FUNG|nr:OTU protein [Coemansia javaensis]